MTKSKGIISVWSPERLVRLVQMRRGGVSIYEIADALNLSESAVRRKIGHLKIPLGKRQKPRRRVLKAFPRLIEWEGAGARDKAYWQACIAQGGFPVANADRGRAALAGRLQEWK